jgi:hypothetical protein
MMVPARMPVAVRDAPIVIVPDATEETVSVVPEIDPVQTNAVVEEDVTVASDVLYPEGVTPVIVMRDPLGIV